MTTPTHPDVLVDLPPFGYGDVLQSRVRAALRQAGLDSEIEDYDEATHPLRDDFRALLAATLEWVEVRTPGGEVLERPVVRPWESAGDAPTTLQPRPAIFPTGATPTKDVQDAFERLSLLCPELDLDTGLSDYEDHVRRQCGPASVEAMFRASRHDRPIELIRRFSAGEADTASPDPAGVGRVSTRGCPRLGSTLTAATSTADSGVRLDITNAVERTVHASYLAAFLTMPDLAEREREGSDDQIWQRWIQNAYVSTDPHAGRVAGLVGTDPFWSTFLRKLDLPEVDKLTEPGSGLRRSLAGLARVGAILMIAERTS